jgi:hypothetical protein
LFEQQFHPSLELDTFTMDNYLGVPTHHIQANGPVYGSQHQHHNTGENTLLRSWQQGIVDPSSPSRMGNSTWDQALHTSPRADSPQATCSPDPSLMISQRAHPPLRKTNPQKTPARLSKRASVAVRVDRAWHTTFKSLKHAPRREREW